jgi:hypothetical protein
VLTSQGVIRCRNEYEFDGERGACIQGVAHFATAYLKWYRNGKSPLPIGVGATPGVRGSSGPSEPGEGSRKPTRWVDDSEYL